MQMRRRSSSSRAGLTHSVVTWVLMAVLVGAVPAAAGGRYVCVRKMAQAGPACSRCHRGAPAPASSEAKPCCEYVAVAAPAMTAPASIVVSPPTSHDLVPGCVPAAATDAASELSSHGSRLDALARGDDSPPPLRDLLRTLRL
jgi:hypothetical protein